MADSKQVVALIHGIRTDAAWAERVTRILSADGDVIVEPLRYDRFDLFRFLCPLFTRTGPIREIGEKLRAIQEFNKDRELSIVAHSFGAHIIATILRKDSFFRTKRVILCGSVVHRKYNWSDVAHKIAEKKVINECGSKDVLPILAQNSTFGYGATGTFGFGHPKVRDRFHEAAHSDFFTEEFVRKYWVPYLSDGTITGSEWEATGDKRSPWWFPLARFTPVRWLLIVALVWMAVTLTGAGPNLNQLLGL